MLEEEKCSADSDRSTVYTILRENNTVGADEIGISSIPAMKIADMGVHLGPIPLGPAVRGDLSLRRRSAAARVPSQFYSHLREGPSVHGRRTNDWMSNAAFFFSLHVLPLR